MKDFPRITHSFTQNYSMNPQYIYSPQQTDVECELDLLDAIDLIVDTMDDYPQARQLLEKLK